MEQSVEQKKRYGLIDTLRGFAVLNMIVYHAIWDFNSFFDLEWTWYDGTAGFVWQQFISWSFILISGFCFLFSSHPYRRGALILACGALVSIVTFVILPSAKIEFGILTFLGCAILLTAVLLPFLQKLPRTMGLILSIVLFVLTRNINDGYLGFASWRPAQIPAWFYQGRVMTYLGFTAPDFFSLGLFFHISLVFFISMRILPLFALQRHGCDGIFALRRCCFCLCGKTCAVVLHSASTAADSAVSCDFGTVLIIKRCYINRYVFEPKQRKNRRTPCGFYPVRGNFLLIESDNRRQCQAPRTGR